MRYVFKRISLLCSALVLLSIPVGVLAAEVQLAVASNFSGAMQAIAQRFEQDSGHTLKLAYGASGKLVAQIRQGAPFEVFLSADSSKPAYLVEQGLAVANSAFTYAHGRLVLWSAREHYVDSRGAVLQRGDFRYLAIANAQLAPYGKAAQQVLAALQLEQRLGPKAVTGQNIAQTYQFVDSGNAELGFVALSQWKAIQPGRGSAWLVPSEYHEPIRQDAVLLAKGKDNHAAGQFMDYLRGPIAQSIMLEYGYEIPFVLARQEYAD